MQVASVDVIGGAFIKVLRIGLLLLLLFPIGVTILASFDSRAYIGSFPPPQLSLRWYTYFMRSPFFLSDLELSFFIGFIASALALIMGIAAAHFIVRRDFKWKGLLTTFFMVPAIVPGVVIGFSLFYFFSILRWPTLTTLIKGHLVLIFPYSYVFSCFAI